MQRTWLWTAAAAKGDGGQGCSAERARRRRLRAVAPSCEGESSCEELLGVALQLVWPSSSARLRPWGLPVSSVLLRGSSRGAR